MKKAPVIISLSLVFLLLGSIIAILLSRNTDGKYIADIYQNGNLIQSIPLYEAEKIYSFEIKGENGCTNLVEVRPGSIAIISADCPDKLCVHQGAISNSLLPITCLPNRLVIQLRAASDHNFADNPDISNSITPDIITY